MLLGTYEHNLDDKGRLTLPSKFRTKLGDTVYISKGFEGSLELRTPAEFEKWYKELSSHSNANSEARLINRQILGNSAEVNIDNAGRIKLPQSLLDLVNIEKSAIILGLGDKAEIWDKDSYDKYTNSATSVFEDVADKLGGAK